MFWRFALFVCGILTLLVGRGFRLLAVLDPSGSGLWNRFFVAVLLLGVLAIAFSFVPQAWMRGMQSQGKQRTPLAVLIIFGLLGFVTTILFRFIPPTTFFSNGLVYTVCPACVFTVTVDPSLATVVLVLAPLDAAVFGAFGGVLGAIVKTLRR